MYKTLQDEFQGITYRELSERVDAVAASLLKLGLVKGDRVAIFSRNRPEWAMADLAILKLGAVVVPIYQTLPPAAVRDILLDSSSKLLFVENAQLYSLVEMIRKEVAQLTCIVAFDSSGINDSRAVLSFSDLETSWGVLVPENTFHHLPPIGPDDAATIVYTSGTTGEPKGATLTHGNILSNALSAMRRFHFTEKDSILSFLPLSHMFERTCGYYTFLFAGGRIAYTRDMTTIVEDVQKIRPTILIAVPRIVEKVYQAVEKKVLASSFLRRKLAIAAMRVLNRCANLAYQGQKIPTALRLQRHFFNTTVASKFRKIAGGNLRLLVSGGAPLDRTIAKSLYILGFNIVQGYGLTETAPVVCSCSVEDNRLGTVGHPLDGVEVRIGDNDEILVRGPNIMKGYFNKPEETAQAIDDDGWFHTGDQGRFDDFGNLIITGRIKELIVTSYGKKVAPASIEANLLRSEYIEQAVLVGDSRKYISALIVPRRDSIERRARQLGIAATSYEELLRTAEIRALIADEIEKATADFASFAKVKTFTLLSESFTVDNHLLTPTLKLRRRRIFEKYEQIIESMYPSDRPPSKRRA
jgi:long-chain acyl-CoA synthetase